MTRFAYRAVPLAGAGVIAGSREAMDERALRDDLRREGLIAVDVRPVSVADALRAAFSNDRARRGDSAWFFSTLAMLLGSRVPVESALATMVDLAPNPRLARAAEDTAGALRSGDTLSKAVERVPGLAAPQHIALLRTGEGSGRLDHVVALVNASIASGEKVRRAVIGKLAYPALLLLVTAGAIWFLGVVVIPKFAEILDALGGDLPWQTSVTLALADVLTWALPVLFAAVVVVAVLRGRLLSPAGRMRLSRWALSVPLVRTLAWHRQSAMLTDAMATMIEGGADVLEALSQASEVVTSPEIARRLNEARRHVKEGVDLGEALDRERVLPPVCSAVVRASLRAGELTAGLRRSAEISMETQQSGVDRLLVFMEPAVILVMAGSVGWVVYSLIVGILAMNSLGGA